jgi:hypothetical protein
MLVRITEGVRQEIKFDEIDILAFGRKVFELTLIVTT